MASTPPSRSHRAAIPTGSPPTDAPDVSTRRNAGPHRGQHTGCAWNRRSAGSPYSLAHSSHSAKSAMVVLTRSYGTSVTMVNRGPQFVQFVKAYRCRRPAGSRSSARHSGQVAVSGEIKVSRVAPPPPLLATIRKPASPAGGTRETVTRSTTARAGAPLRSAATSASTAAASPSASTNTPAASLPTKPETPYRTATSYTKGR